MSEPTELHQEYLDSTREAESAGDYLLAYDRACRAISRFPNSEELKYLAVRAIARAGSLAHAERLYESYGLHQCSNVDISSLGARISKDKFIQNRRDTDAARRAASLYQRIYERTGDPYPAINASTLWMLSGDATEAHRIARDVIEISRSRTPKNLDEEYWHQATLAEAALVLDDVDLASISLAAASAVKGQRADAVASTCKQLTLICEAKGIDAAWLDLLKRQSVAVFTGHMISPPDLPGRFPAGLETEVADQILDELKGLDVGFGYGSLASGSDILFGEALLTLGAELHVVLPFDAEEFKKISVEPAGSSWIDRFERCLSNAQSVTFATRDAYLGDDLLFAYAAKIAMGLARIRSRALDAPLAMLAVWDGEPTNGAAGTATDISYWASTGLPFRVIEIARHRRSPVDGSPNTGAESKDINARSLLPVLFGDFRGFSKLQEQHLPTFNKSIMGCLGETLRAYGDSVMFSNSWGDAVHAVFSDIETAADCALEMQDRLLETDHVRLGLPEEIGMRASLHVGPVFVGSNQITDGEIYFGHTLTRAARMEPVTPVGEVYVTEQFAALIEMSRGSQVTCNYVGIVPLAKNYGELRMYRLARSATP